MNDNTNGVWPAIATIVVAILIVRLFDWPGLIAYVLGFLVGGLGTVVNARRWMRDQRER